jgi:hypothetical protein
MGMRQYKMTVNSAADGTATGFSQRIVGGKIHSIRYIKGDYADTVDFTITKEATGENVWVQSNVTASATIYPRIATVTTTNSPALYAAEGTAVRDTIGIAVDRIKVELAQAGANKTGQFLILVEV